MITRQSFLSLCWILATANTAYANNLAEWTNNAFNHHPERKLAAAEQNLGNALHLKAGQWLASPPRANIFYQTDAVGSGNGYREWEAGVDLPLWLPGQQDLYREEANSSRTLADAIHQAKRLETAGQVRQRLWDFAEAKTIRDQIQSSLTIALKLLKDVERRVAAGELPRSDHLLAKQIVLLDEDKLQQANNKLQQQLLRFKSYTGAPDVTKVVPETITTATRIEEQHPLLRLAHHEVLKAQAHKARVAEGQHTGPTVWLGAKTTRAASGQDYDNSVGIELSMPFGEQRYHAPEKAEAEQALTKTISAREQMQIALEESLQQALLEQQRTTESLARAKHRMPLAEESLKLSRRAFELGEIDLVRLIKAQSDADNSHQDLLLSNIHHHRAIANLNQALGVIPQ